MNFRHLALLSALVVAPMLVHAATLQSIFDGERLRGWEGNAQTWRVESGAITGEIPAGQKLAANEFIFWEGELHDFELELEFRLSGVPTLNSGIQFRSQRRADGHAAGYQADLDDGAEWMGRIYDEEGRALLVERGTRVSIAPDGRRWVDPFAAPESFRALFKRDGWNQYRITARASHVEIWINGTLTSVLDDHQTGEAEFSGRLALQMHSGDGPAKVQFRNVRIAHLGSTALPQPSSADAAGAIAPLTSTSATGADGKPLNLGFESGTLADWTAEGSAFAAQPVRYSEPDTPRRKNDQPTDPVGAFWIGSSSKTPLLATGKLTSTTFAVTHRWGSYLVGGGEDINQTRVELVDAASGAIVHSSSGTGSDALRREVIDFSSAVGRRIFIRLVDNATAGLTGHIAFDDFVFHNRQPDFSTDNADFARLHESPVLWHLQPNPAPPSPVANLDAQKLVRDIKLVAGFQAELVAAEPDVHQPVAFAIDERGRLWIAEAFSYPSKQPAGAGKDRVIILEDGDGDGVFETRKVFATGLNLVSGLEVGFGGVWVGAAPELLFIPDRNHDDQPDGAPEVLLDGWGFQDTHETLNSFTWGPDGWLYGDHGVFTNSNVGKPGTPADQRVHLRAGVWRYHPVRREFEVFASGGSNQWGIDFNRAGHLFMTHCRSFNGGGGTTHVIRNAHFWNQANADYAPFISNRAPDFAPELKNFLPSSARYDSGEGGAGKPGTTAVYGGHSHVGTMIYLGDNWPEIYREQLFTINLHGHQINQQHNVRQGSGYETFHAGFDLLYVPDKTFVGVDLQYGPDGAVYIIDWCDHQHCHSPRDDIWERTNGRVYRVAWKDSWKPAHVNLASQSDVELAKLHTHASEWYVRTARRLLEERAASRTIEPAALPLLRGQAARRDDMAQALRGLWTLHAIGALDAVQLAGVLQHPDDLMRSWGVQLATEVPLKPAVPAATLVQLAANDPSPAVRLALASAMPALPAETSWAIGAALARHGEDANDRFLPKMIWFGLAPLVTADYARALKLAGSTALPSLADSMVWYIAQKTDGRGALAAHLAAAPEAVAGRGARIMAFALASDSRLPMPSGWSELARRLATAEKDSPVAIATAQLAALFGDEAVLAQSRALLANPQAAPADRQAALDRLKRARDAAAVSIYIKLLDDDAFRSAVLALLAGVDNPAVVDGIVRHFPTFGDADRAVALATMTSHPAQGVALLTAIKSGAFEKKNLTSLHVRQLRNLRDERVDALLDELWGKAVVSAEGVKQSIERYRKLYAEAPLWAFSATPGRETFQKLCATCHQYEGAGGKLGPDLSGSWRNGADYFIENIVDPNAVIGVDFQLNIITKRDGTVVSGMVERETETALVVRTETTTQNVPKSEVANREVLPQSLMPPGLLEALPDREVLELLKFLAESR